MGTNEPQAETTLSALVAEEIRSWMGRRRITGAQLARSLGVSSAWVSYRLTGTQPIDLNDLDRIARILDVAVADLLPRSTEGRLITTAAPRGGTRAGTNDRSTRLSEWPRTGGHTSRTPRPTSTTRPARLRPAHA